MSTDPLTDLERQVLRAEIAVWKDWLTWPGRTDREKETTRQLIDDAETALKTGHRRDYQTLRREYHETAQKN